MIYLDPQLEASLIQSGYEEMVDPVFVEQNQHRIATFSSGVQSILAKTGFNPAGKKLLDVGCAGGAFWWLRAQLASKYRASNRAAG